MSSGARIQLDPPQRRRWVKFGDWDEEALEFRPSPDKPIPMSLSDLSISSSLTSVSSVAFSSSSEFSSSISSDSLDWSRNLRRKSVLEPKTTRPTLEFNASFGGTALNGSPAGLRSSWLNPNQQNLSIQHRNGPSLYFDESEVVSPSYLSSSDDDKILRYSVFAELEDNKDFSLGWSRDLKGDMDKEDSQVLQNIVLLFCTNISVSQ